MSGIILRMESPLLSGLNAPQREAVLHEHGPVLIFAGAGSGKTNALTKRIAYLIQERGVRPYNILAVTFTNKAAAEMKERIGSLIGDAALRELWAGTFHALCARCLRERGDQIGLDKRFTIYDDGDQLSVVKECVRELDLDDKQFAPRAMLSVISKAKESLQTPDDVKEAFAASPFERAAGRVYQRYQDKLTTNGALDFDDLIMKTVQLLRESERARAHYQNRFQFVHCDEFQDVNDSQYQLLTLFSGKHKNICVVGDDDQCVVEGTPILTPQGYVPVETVKEGDTVLAACGGPHLAPAVVEAVRVSDYTGTVRHIRTNSETSPAMELRVTPNHIMFGSIVHDAPPDEWAQLGYEWHEGDDENDAGARPISDAVHFVMFADTERNGHRIPALAGLPSFGVGTFTKPQQETAIFTNYNDAWDYTKRLQSRHDLSSVRIYAQFTQGSETLHASILSPYYYVPVVTPPTMTSIRLKRSVTQYQDAAKVTAAQVESVTDEDYTGKVYDLSVANLRNYVAGGIVVHNSIYAFRGANVQIILNFERDFPQAQIIKLEQNYRSTRTILDAAYHVVRHNKGRADKRLWTENVEGEQLTLVEAPNEIEEAVALVNVIREGTIAGDRRFADFAVLYRANSQSRAIEEQMLNYRIPYKIVGGVRFYERKEIKDLLAYLRVLSNPYDGVSLRRIINVPTRKIGLTTVEKIANFAGSREISLWDALRRVEETGVPQAAKNSIAAFVKAIEYLRNAE